MNNYIELAGISTPFQKLKSSKAKELSGMLIKKVFHYVTFVDSLIDMDNSTDIVVFDIEVELAQKIANDIRPVERIACVFYHFDDIIPRVYALRDDFPLVPHLNLTEYEYPKSLCLSDENYDELKISWSNNELILRIANWLSKTSMNKLHGIDQPLESLLASSSDTVILPDTYFDEPYSLYLYKFIPVKSERGRTTYIAKDFHSIQNNICYISITLTGKPMLHGIIRQIPKNLYELSQFANIAEIDIIKELRDMCRDIILEEKLSINQYKSMKFILILCLPKIRAINLPQENYEFRAFILNKNILDVGISLGIYEVIKGHPGLIFSPYIKEKVGEDISLQILNVQESFSRKQAAHINRQNVVDNKITMIGAGALGSHLFNSSLRTGFGQWTIIDDDEFFPHNIGRHILNMNSVGRNKAGELIKYGKEIIQTKENIYNFIPSNILPPYKNEKDIKDALENTDIILDVSTSIAVERFLAFYHASNARRISAFFNPAGTDLVMLIESKTRSVTVDFLEIQYYRNLIYTSELEEHIKLKPEQIRYASSCRDISNRIPQENIVILSSICFSFLRQSINIEEGAIHIWHINQDNYNVKNYSFPVYDNQISKNKTGWDIITDEYLKTKLINARKEKLPLETGGILLGSYDMSRKIIYITDTIISPPDSVERPISYIRGCSGLAEKVNKIIELTQSKLDYIGEWHSHPCGYSDKPSDYDKTLLCWITNHMKNEGFPGLMIICSDTGLNIIISEDNNVE